MSEFARVVLPLNRHDDGILCMLAAYFDDSGTHDGSDIVLMAGVFGFPNQFDLLSKLWASKLADPCPGKVPLTRFHMAECQAADGEFLGWKRIETDFLVHELGSIILRSGIYGFGGAIARKHWEELVTGDVRQTTGDAETMCIINCFSKTVAFANEFAPGHDVAFIFEDRPQKKQNIEKIFSIYRGFREAAGRASVSSLSFSSSRKMLPLQVADLFAWEIYQDSLATLAGRAEEEGPHRQQLFRLMKGGRVRVEFCGRESVRQLTQVKIAPAVLQSLKDYGAFFDC
jgi:uncharacterized protein DUF3800